MCRAFLEEALEWKLHGANLFSPALFINVSRDDAWHITDVQQICVEWKGGCLWGVGLGVGGTVAFQLYTHSGIYSYGDGGKNVCSSPRASAHRRRRNICSCSTAVLCPYNHISHTGHPEEECMFWLGILVFLVGRNPLFFVHFPAALHHDQASLPKAGVAVNQTLGFSFPTNALLVGLDPSRHRSLLLKLGHFRFRQVGVGKLAWEQSSLGD